MWLRFGSVCLCVLALASAAAADECTSVTNLAAGKPVTITVTGNDASLPYEGESSADVTDGSRSYIAPELRQEDGCIGWRNSEPGRTMTVTVRIDLLATCDVKTIRCGTGDTAHADTWAADTMTTSFGSTPVTAGAPSAGAWTTHYGSATGVTSVTVTLKKTNSGTNRDWMFIGEIEVYGTTSGPPPSMNLNVAFLKQFFTSPSCPDGGHGSCGPASLAMCACYVLGRAPTYQDIINVWSFLGRDTCGNDMNGTSLTELRNAARGWPFGLTAVTRSTFTLQQVKNELVAGRPVLVHVIAGYLTNRGYSYTGGHYIVARGYDPNNIICNDPGTYLGENKYYSNSDMVAAMTNTDSGVLCNFMR